MNFAMRLVPLVLVAGAAFSTRAVPVSPSPVRRVGVVNWDCSVPSTTFFGKATTYTLGPKKWRDRTPYYAHVLGDDKIEHHYRSLEEYEVEMQYAIDAGIDYFAYCWYDLTPPPGDNTPCAGKLQEITRARLQHVESRLRDKLSLCAILVTSHPYSDECLRLLAKEMRNPWYEKVDGRPLVYMFSATHDVAPRLRAICREHGMADPYVVSMISNSDPATCREKYVHADALSAYGSAEEGPLGEDYVSMTVLWNSVRASAGLPVIPLFSTGWNPTPRLERPNPWASYPAKPYVATMTRENWLDEAAKLRRWIERNPGSCPTGHVLAFAWNEFEEGGWICPNIGEDGRPDTSRVQDFRQVVAALKSPEAEKAPVLNRHGYFTDEALAEADVEGLDREIALAFGKCDKALASAAKTSSKLSGHERIALERRIEIAKRLKRYIAARACAPERDELILAWQGAKDLEVLLEYFQREAARVEAREKMPAPVEVDVRDFGAKGDGQHDDGPAIRAALEAARANNGAPTVVVLPAGRYLVGADPRSPFRDFSLHDWQTGDNRGDAPYWKWSSTSLHLFLHNLDNVTVRGAGSDTVVAFADSTMAGFGLYGCSGCAIENLVVDYPDNPSTQGVIEKVEQDPFALVFRRQEGYPDPDSPRFMDAKSRYFSPVGADGRYLPGGVGRMGAVERLSNDCFRFTPLPQHVDDPVWRAMKSGDSICIVARYAENSAHPVKAQWSAFCSVRNIRFLDSPGQVVWFSGCYALAIVGCRATGRDDSDDCVAGNADAILGSGLIGPYVSDCAFSGLEDDGINIGSNTGEISMMPPDRRLTQCRTNGSQPAAGGFVSDGNDSLIKMFFRYGENDVATRPLPANVVTAADVRRAEGEDMAWFDKVTAKGRGLRRSDKNIRIPNTAGAVLRNTEFSNLRGRGIQVHCGNMLIENVKVHDVTGVGISIHALPSWSMCFDIYNVLVRNCSFERLGGGCAVSTCPGWIDPEKPMSHRMHFAIELDGCTIDPGGGKPGVRVSNADDVTIKACRFGPGCSLPPVETKNSTLVKLVE